jgi:hypothetical protein
VATLNFTGTDRKTFTPVSSALGQLTNGPGTMVALVQMTLTGAVDIAGLTDSTASNFYHTLLWGSAGDLQDDDGLNLVQSASASAPQDTTNWWWVAMDWGSTAGTLNFRIRNQTTAGSWTTNVSTNNGRAAGAGPGTGGWFKVGACGDNTAGARNYATVGVWAGTRFSGADFGVWSKTSDLWNHSLGHPTFLTELNSSTPVDLAGGSTYASGSSSGTTLTGGNPDSFTLDGVGSSAVAAPRTFNAIPFIGGGL